MFDNRLNLTVCLVMLRTSHREAVDAIRASLHLMYVSIAEAHDAVACIVYDRPHDSTRLVGPSQVAVGSVRVVDVVERATLVPDVDVDTVGDVRFDENTEPVDAVDRLL